MTQWIKKKLNWQWYLVNFKLYNFTLYYRFYSIVVYTVWYQNSRNVISDNLAIAFTVI